MIFITSKSYIICTHFKVLVNRDSPYRYLHQSQWTSIQSTRLKLKSRRKNTPRRALTIRMILATWQPLAIEGRKKNANQMRQKAYLSSLQQSFNGREPRHQVKVRELSWNENSSDNIIVNSATQRTAAIPPVPGSRFSVRRESIAREDAALFRALSHYNQHDSVHWPRIAPVCSVLSLCVGVFPVGQSGSPREKGVKRQHRVPGPANKLLIWTQHIHRQWWPPAIASRRKWQRKNETIVPLQ